MKVLMFGWEFPPFNTGGLGTACYGLTKELSKQGVNVCFVLPRKVNVKAGFLKFLFAGISEFSSVTAYSSSSSSSVKGVPYGNNLMEAVNNYAINAINIALNENFDVIHAHDWLTIRAGITAKELSGKPLIFHVHATEFDRTGGNGVNQQVYDIEREGMHKADMVVTVSNYTRNKIINHYGVNPDKVRVIHNGGEPKGGFSSKRKGKKTVLFLGRITLQKGPDYFLYTARRVLDYCPNTQFVMAGKGDMMCSLINRSIEMGISDKFLFTGYLSESDKEQVYKIADLFVMPSVSEPFGITPLESLTNGTPVLISKQSGVSEVLTHCLKTDFWDVNDMSNKIISVLNHSELHECLSVNGFQEVCKLNWSAPASKCVNFYNKLASAS